MQSMKKPAALNINFDSIRECLKLVGVSSTDISWNDPSFFSLSERFFSLAEKYKAKFTIFIIGKDLLNQAHVEQVRQWSLQGHEIANHTYSHHQNFGYLRYKEMYDEIKRSHDLISECIGHEPKGFVAPAWSYAPKQLDILEALAYKYDSSLFPSFLMPLIQLKLRFKSNLPRRMIPLLRKDIFGSVFGSRQPFLASKKKPWKRRKQKKGIVMLPLPVTSFRVPIWHSMSFLYDKKKYRQMIERAIDAHRAFYYLMHPVDLLCPKRDVVNIDGRIMNIERSNVPLDQKMELIENVFELLSQKCTFVTMSELADRQMRHLSYDSKL